MADQKDRIDELNEKLNLLLSKQKHFAQEIQGLYQEIQTLKKTGITANAIPEKVVAPVKEITLENETKPIIEASFEEIQKETVIDPVVALKEEKTAAPPKNIKPKGKSNLEKFIGENLINKIGIAILVIGVAIGAKYSIENNLISPLTRIISGYLAGLGLIGFGIKLKAKYENYSAVLVSGALAILYFITFAAYSFYELFPQLMAFGLMLIFTIFGVVAAINYNKQVIAHIGLVGAYAVPFLLSNDSGNVTALFTYMIIINIGVLIIAFKKYWKPLYYSAFIFTWLIYITWFATSYMPIEDFQLALIVATAFFVMFYCMFLAYKLLANEKFQKSDVVLLLLNSFVFYGIGFGLLLDHKLGSQLLGVFTLANAVIHFGVSAVLFKRKLADRNLFYLVSGLVLVFITIAVPVQLDGSWVTLIWSFEAALLFWIGRTKNVPVYENLSYPLMLLAFLSLMQDWSFSWGGYYVDIKPLLNIYFLTSILFVAAFGFILWVSQKTNKLGQTTNKFWMVKLMSIAIPVLFLFVLFATFFLEINNYGDILYYQTEIPALEGESYTYSEYDNQLLNFKEVWLINYCLLFVSLMAFANIKKLKDRIFGIATMVLGVLTTILFLTAGLYILSELRQSFIYEELAESYNSSGYNIGIRYVAYCFFALLLFALYKLSKASFMRVNLKIEFEIIMHVALLWVLSSELLNWMDILGSAQTYKLGLSILWGVYSLFLIALGIYKNKKHLRIGAMALFGITLIKLFFYDIESMNTITKTIVFVSLGILLLIISFLYNKYKHKISDEHDELED